MIWYLMSLLLLELLTGAAASISQPLCTINTTAITCHNIQSDSRNYLIDFTSTNVQTGSTVTTMEFYDSMISDLPNDSFTYVTAIITTLKFFNCVFNQFPSVAMTYFSVAHQIEVADSFIALINPAYMSSTYFKSSVYQINITNTELIDIPTATFSSMAAVTSIVLANNTIKTIQSQAFLTLAALQTVDLSGNDIQSIGLGNFVAPVLTSLYLHDNNLMVLDNNTFLSTSMPKLSQLTLAGNPFICNCNLQWLKDYVQVHDVLLDDASCVCPQLESFDDVVFCGWENSYVNPPAYPKCRRQ